MTSDIPPLTPPDADLQDFPFMPLHVARLRDSDLAAEAHPEGCWYAVLLWAASWHQEPAGSLPDNDAVLTRLCGLGRDVRTFRKRRDDALRGFVLCSDGRLYHPVVAEQVLAAWKGKIEQRHRAECARIKKANQRNETNLEAPRFEQFMSEHFPASVPYLSPRTTADVLGDMASKRQRQGEREGQGDSITGADAPGAAPAPDPDKVMFDAGVRFLGDNGLSEGKARQLLGKWRRDYGAEAVITALGKAQREGAIDPTAFIEGCLRNGQRPRGDTRSGGYRDPILARHLGGRDPDVGGPA